MIAIINYGSGNVGAIANIYKQLGVEHFIASVPDGLQSADKYILPGVGHFDTTMNHINRSGLREALEANVFELGKPLLGICVGMQILADASEEGISAGLGWISGRVLKLRPDTPKTRLPHMGWNSVEVKDDPLNIFTGVDRQQGFYFLHNYYFCPNATGTVAASANYGQEFACAVSNGRNVIGVQFHPEKSHRNGVTLFRNFAAL